MKIKKVLLKEYKTYNLYAIYKDDKFLYKTCISNIKDNYKNKNKNQWGELYVE